eukprot:TRINITY_DN37483_c0_g1_i1.p1 TRINITY_DN37483_c0_g1~~TRINITY_DN37483_c0_g1_i1.p1  ORF type:complete len:317 (+),score=67.20 TRINITY_DN37483_c0_g1_i1:39-953(+)
MRRGLLRVVVKGEKRWCAAKAAPGEEPDLEEMRERQRWQDRYEFSDEEIEEELKGEKKWKEQWRGGKNWLRYYLNIFEEHDNLSERRERWQVLIWKDVRLVKSLIGLAVLTAMLYSEVARDKLFAKLREFSMKGSGTDWPTHYIELREIHEGKRNLDQIMSSWEKVRDAHQRDWLLPLLAAQALVNFVSQPAMLSNGGAPPDAVIEKLAEELSFIEADVTRMSAEVALHLHNLKSGDVKWPGRQPNKAVMEEITEAIAAMSDFKIHPVLVERLEMLKNKDRVFFGGTGYFTSSSKELQEKTITA